MEWNENLRFFDADPGLLYLLFLLVVKSLKDGAPSLRSNGWLTSCK